MTNRAKDLKEMSRKRHEIVKILVDQTRIRVEAALVSTENSVPKGILDLAKTTHELSVREELAHYELVMENRLTLDKAAAKLLASIQSVFIEQFGLEESDRLIGLIKEEMENTE